MNAILLDLGFLLFLQLFFGVLGLPFAPALRRAGVERPLWALSTLGYALTAMAATAGYSLYLSIPLLAWIFGLGVIALFARAILSAGRQSFGSLDRIDLRALGLWLLVSLVMLLPKWLGGPRFWIYQANQFDTLGYLSSAEVFARVPFHVLRHWALPDPSSQLIPIAHNNLYERPAVHVVYALVTRFFPGQLYRLYYAYYVFMLTQVFWVALSVFPRVLGISRRAVAFIASAFLLGFWGQYILDMNSWSQMGSMPVLLLLIGLVCLVRPSEEAGRSQLLLFSLLIAASLYIYPESAVVQVPLILLGILAVSSDRIELAKKYIFSCAIGAVLAAIFFSGTYGQILKQARTPGSVFNSWSSFWQLYQHGRLGAFYHHVIFKTVDFFWSLIGFYFITPDPSLSGDFTQGIIHLALAALAVVLIWGLLSGRSSSVPVDAGAPRRRLFAFLAAMIAAVVYFRWSRSVWHSGKLLSYASIYLFLWGGAALTRSRSHHRLRVALAGILLGAQLAFCAARIVQASGGVAHPSPYIDVQNPEEKFGLDWQPEQWIEESESCKRVRVEVPDWIQRAFAEMALDSVNRAYTEVPQAPADCALRWVGHEGAVATLEVVHLSR